jgi:type IV pilus assembly protein PilY1
MTSKYQRAFSLIVGAAWIMLAGFPAVADDTELFVYSNFESAGQPNVLFILDNSAAQGAAVSSQPNYVSSTTYDTYAGCDPSRTYWSTNGRVPDCSETNNWFNESAIRCYYAQEALGAAGYYTGRMAQYDATDGSGGKRWENISADYKDRVIECEDDAGEHGDGINTTNLWASNGGTDAGGSWGPESAKIRWGRAPTNESYTIYDGNWLNWNEMPVLTEQSKLEIIQDTTNDVLASVNGINVGLMYFNRNTNDANNGGNVGAAMGDVGRNRRDGTFATTIQSLTPSGMTPLSETLYEAAQYFAGRDVVYGDNSVATSIVNGSNPKQYISPLDIACQKNYIVILTDGEPTNDEAADSLITTDMRDAANESFTDLVTQGDDPRPDGVEASDPSTPSGTCDVETYGPDSEHSGGECLDDLAEFLHKGDWSSQPDQQNITTHTIGFTIDLPILKDTATRGGGTYHTVNDAAGLALALTTILSAVKEVNISFTAPTVAVNSFNRTQTLSDLFISVFRPDEGTHWHGNLKKYRVEAGTGEILDFLVENPDLPAVDPATGFFREGNPETHEGGAWSFWSSAADGNDVELGGAANLITTTRRVLTHFSGTDLTLVEPTATAVTDVLEDALQDVDEAYRPSVDEVIDFINGVDTPDTDGDSDHADARTQMGDPFHSQPASVVYGPGLRDGIIFVGTNDGYLHAIDLETGEEQWAFIPPEFLELQVDLYNNVPVASKSYGIDGDIRIQMVADSDGVIEPGEKVYLFFGAGRGGQFYYALDVSVWDDPKFLWKLDGSTLPGLGYTMSAAMPTRIDIADAPANADNPEKLVLVLGGGYELDQDNSALTADTTGNSIYIVDSESGALLWHGGYDGRDKDFNVSGRSMSYSIPGRIRVVDMDGNGFADRLYAGDMGGQVWRFDIANGEPAASLINGGVIASVGGAANSGATNVRRFYNAPDVAFISTPTGTFMHVGIGSGHRGHPLDLVVEDYFYALRDSAAPLTQAQFDARTVIQHGDLPIVSGSSTVPSSGGWKFALNVGGWHGEKVLAEARTFANQVIFSTFAPTVSAVMGCEPTLGTNRTYVVNVYNGSPVLNLDGSADGSDDLFVQAEGGILPAAQVLFLANDLNNDGIPDVEIDSDGDGIPDSEDEDPDGDGTSYAEEDPDNDGIPNAEDDDDDGDGILDADEDDGGIVCVGLRCFTGLLDNDPIRTFWAQESLD